MYLIGNGQNEMRDNSDVYRQINKEEYIYVSSFNSEFFQLTTSDFIYLLILSSVCTAYAFIASSAVMKFLSPYTCLLYTSRCV